MIGRLVKRDLACQLLMSILGVGVLSALSFKTAIDDPARFSRVTDVGAVLGLTPKKYQSGEVDCNGRISKQGDRSTRAFLYEAVSCLLSRYGTETRLAKWAHSLRQRMGYKKSSCGIGAKAFDVDAQHVEVWRALQRSTKARTKSLKRIMVKVHWQIH